MIKNKLDYRLINITIIGIILFLMYQTSNLWIGLLDKILIIFGPFVVAFAIAYALNPFVLMLEKKKISHKISVLIVSLTLMLSIVLLAVLVLPTLFNQTISFLNSIDAFIQEMVVNYNIDLGNLGVLLESSIEEFSKSIGTYVTEGAMKTISMSLGFLTNLVIVLAVAIYFLFDFNTIRNFIKLFLVKRSQRLFNYVKLLDNEITNYLGGLVKVTIIAYFEYTIAFLIIGHPNALLIGFLAAPANFIPFIGGFINNILAIITAFVVGPALFIKTIILSFILANADSYIINPTIFGKSNKIHPLLVIFAVFASATIFGVAGIFIALPLAIILTSTFKFYKDDIIDTFKKDN